MTALAFTTEPTLAMIGLGENHQPIFKIVILFFNQRSRFRIKG
jgi:hypothetical protein